MIVNIMDYAVDQAFYILYSTIYNTQTKVYNCKLLNCIRKRRYSGKISLNFFSVYLPLHTNSIDLPDKPIKSEVQT